MRLLQFSLIDEVVDELFRVIIADTCRAARTVLTVASNDRDLDGELAGTGVAQHPGKLEFCSAFWSCQPRS